MKKVTGTQLIIGGILLYLLFRSKSGAGNTINPVRTSGTNRKRDKIYNTQAIPLDQISGEWEMNCYHQVI